MLSNSILKIKNNLNIKNKLNVINNIKLNYSNNNTNNNTIKYTGNNTLGIVSEDFSMWERRVPLSPQHIKKLIIDHNIKVLVQPSKKRVFTDNEYERVGAIITENINEASLIIGVKQIPADKIIKDKNYMFFSHTIKAQPHNMHLLDTLLERNARLFDYETIVEQGKEGSPRVVAFGKFAGIAGMIDCLQGLGQKLLCDGYSTPFLNVSLAYMYTNLNDAKENITKIGKIIETNGIHKDISPLVFAFTGSGNVNKGNREIFELLPHIYINSNELKTLKDDIRKGKRPNNVVYGVLTTVNDMVKKSNGSQLTDKAHYYANPHEYIPCFHETIIPYTTVLVNGFYWDARYPRLLTNQQIKALRKTGNKTLKMVADVTCDPNGSVEFLSHCTPIEKPFFSYMPESGKDMDSIEKDGICMLGVEILPTELPRDASEFFGNSLMPLIPPLLKSKGSISQDDMGDIPAELRRACIASHGKLLPRWEYIQRLREHTAVIQKTGAYSASIVLTGHLFDTGLVNKVLDYFDDSHLKYSISNLNVRPNLTSGPVPTRLELQLTGEFDDINAATDAIEEMIKSNPASEGTVTLQGSLKSVADVRVKSQKKVLLLGAGMVAMPVIRVLGEAKDVHLTVASDNKVQALNMIKQIKDHESKLRYQPFSYPQDMNIIEKIIKESDVIVSLMPATMHIPFAELAIKHKRHLVTASYVSDAMQQLNEKAKENGVILLNGK